MTNKFFTGITNHSLTSVIQKLHRYPQKNKIITMQQVHGNNISDIDSVNLSHLQTKSSSHNIININSVDACFTTQKSIVLSVKSADCLPILISGFGFKVQKNKKELLLPHKKNLHPATQSANTIPFIAAAHAGRKGTQLNILYKLLEKLDLELNIVDALKMQESKAINTNSNKNETCHSNTNKKIINNNKNNNQLNIWFGPAICFNCYQIDRKTNTHYNLIEENKKQILQFFKKHQLNSQKNLNLEIENHCTMHEPKKYHSYRKTGPGVKMNYSFIEII